MATITNIAPLSLSFFQADFSLDTIFRGLAGLGLVELFAAAVLSCVVALLVATVFAGRFFNERTPPSLLLSLLLIVVPAFIPVIESTGLSLLSIKSISVGDGIALAVAILIPIFVLIGLIWGALELLRYGLGVRLETELQRFVAAVAVIFLFALAAPSFEMVTSSGVKAFIRSHAAVVKEAN